MRPRKAVRIILLHARCQLKLSDNHTHTQRLNNLTEPILRMKEEPGEHSGQGGDPVVPGYHKVDQVVVGLPVLLPVLAPLEADLGDQVTAHPRHTSLVGNLLGPVQPPEILGHRPRILVAVDEDDGQVPRHQEAVGADQGLRAIGCLH